MNECEELVAIARSLFDRGYTFGTAGNMSVRVDDRIVVTPTNTSFFNLNPHALSMLELDGTIVTGPPPSKEAHFHVAAYRARPDARAVVHLHSCYAAAVSCLSDLNLDDALPIYTPYYAIRLPCLPVVEYFPPGDAALAPAVEKAAAKSPALLLRNHGSITMGNSLMAAAALAEEVEEQARLYFLLGGCGDQLSPGAITKLRKKWR